MRSNRIYALIAGVGLALGSAGVGAAATTGTTTTNSSSTSSSSMVAEDSSVPARTMLPAAPTSATSIAGARAVVCKYDFRGTRRGCAGFYPTLDTLSSCDYRRDGNAVVAYLYWSGATRMYVVDRNEAYAGCGIQQLDGSIAEGTPVWLKVCVANIGCSPWRKGIA